MEYPKRKSIRLQEFDYHAGAYFVTICTHQRRCIMSRISVGAFHEAPAASVVLTPIGKIVQEQIDALPSRYPNVSVTHSVVMPNHIHLLLEIRAERAIHESPLRDKRSMLSKVIGYLKMNSSKQIHAIAPNLVVWQRSYHEHVIRNEQDYLDIWNYIENNPAKWALDRYYEA